MSTQQFSLWWINSGSGPLSVLESIKSGVFNPDSGADTDTENLAAIKIRIADVFTAFGHTGGAQVAEVGTI